MKKRAIAVMLLTVMVLVALSAGIAQAAWCTCTVLQVGSTGSNYWITATDTTTPTALFTNTTFLIDESNGRGKEMYAAALTAFANNSLVQIWVDSPYSAYSTAWGVIAIK